jgi:hypothetical protein
VKGNYLRITDTVQFSYLASDWTKVKDDYEGAFKPPVPGATHPSGMGQQPMGAEQQQQNVDTHGLLVSIAATHSGIITRNNGFYLPDRMKKGAPSFTENYGKPILLHHKDHEDNVGRIKIANYMDTSGGVIEKYDGLQVKNSAGKQIATFNEAMIKDFVGGKLPFGTQVDVVRSVFRDHVLDESGYEGLGHIQIVADVTDPVAIQKLLDGRYLTGSVGATTNRAVCSICRSDWTETGPCEHKPGGIYDDAKCFIIAGDLSYDEYSFVNVPADRHSKVLQLHYNGIQDSIDVVNDFGRIYEVQLEFPQYDSVNKEENSMAKDAKKKDGDLDIKDSANTNPAPETENADGAKDTQVQDSAPETTETQPEDGKVEDGKKDDESNIEDSKTEDGKVEDSTEESDLDFTVRVLDGSDEPSEDDKQRAYGMLWDEVKAAAEAGVIEGVKDNVDELKLSDEKRAALAKSQFCTSKRVFPVHDAAHIVAAYRLVNKLGLADELKDKLLKVLNRKARVVSLKLDDSVTTSKKVEDNMTHARLMHGILNLMEEDVYYSDEPVLDEDEKKMLQSILKRLAGLVGKDAVIAAALAEGLAQQETALLDEIATHEEKIGDLQERLDATQKEYHLLFEDMQNLQDSLVEEKASTRKIQEAHLSTLLTLKDSEVKEHDFSELSDTEVETKIKDASEGVDMVKITDKLGDGMSRTPEGNVEDPSGVQDNANQKSKISVDSLETIHANYVQLRMSRGEAAAEAYLTDMKRQGFLPQDSEN